MGKGGVRKTTENFKGPANFQQIDIQQKQLKHNYRLISYSLKVSIFIVTSVACA